MISDVDRTLRNLLELECGDPLPFDISFVIPDKDFAPASSSRHTLNCYLYDISEDRELRSNEPQMMRSMDGRFERIPPPARVKLSYCITAWSPAAATPAIDPALDEHRLLSEVLIALLKYSTLPSQVLEGALANQEIPPPTTVILPNGIKNPGDFWNAIGGQLRPSLDYGVTIAMDYKPKETGAVVTTKKTAYSQTGDSTSDETFFEIGGYVTNNTEPFAPVGNAWVLVEETGRTVKTDTQGRYVVGDLSGGEFTISVKADGFQDVSVKFQAPEPDGDYTIRLVPKTG